MAFTQFNSRAGHSAMADEVVAALKDVALRHGVNFRVNGGSLGANDMMLKLEVSTQDTSAVENEEKQRWGWNCRSQGLEPDDYGAEIEWADGDRFRIIEIHTNRPKFPFSGVSARTGKTYKLGRGVANKIIAGRATRPKAPPPPLPSEKPMAGFAAQF